MESLEIMQTAEEIEQLDLEYILKKTKTEFKKLKGKTILFTGANGFLGYYFIKSIFKFNDLNPKSKISIIALDTFPKGIPHWMKKRAELKTIKKDITKFKPTSSKKYDYIIHAASIASPTFYRKHPIETIEANIFGLKNILDYAVKVKQKKFIKGILFFSSSEIYGDPDNKNIPTTEEYRGFVSCTGPRACYDESKRFGETLCVNYAQVHKLPIKIARPFNNYGPGLRIGDRRVIPDFANDILNNRDITLLSGGSPTRTFCYITDAIIGYIKILVNGKNAESYNIGIEKPEVSIIELAEKMQKIGVRVFSYNGKIIKEKSQDKNYLTDNPNRRCPSIKKAKTDLGFSPEISLEKGLENSLIWYQGNSK